MRAVAFAIIALAVLFFGATPELDPGDVALPDGGVQDWDGGTECACASGAATCLIPNPNEEFGGGPTVSAPRGTTLQPGWVGAGCVPKACVEPAGEQGSSWPPGCPP